MLVWTSAVDAQGKVFPMSDSSHMLRMFLLERDRLSFSAGQGFFCLFFGGFSFVHLQVAFSWLYKTRAVDEGLISVVLQ